MKANVNTSSRAMREAMAEGCGPSPLCRPCGFTSKRVPTAWKVSPPGTPYPCDDPALGVEVILRGDRAPSRVVGCATPTGPGLLQFGRVSQRRQCEGSLLVRTPLGLVTPVARSVVRERLRQQGEAGRATCRCAGLPWPHREGSTPLCARWSGGGLEELRDLASDAWEDERREPAFVAAATRAARGRREVSSVDDARGVLRELDAMQRDAFAAAEARRMEPRSAYRKRVSSARREARREGWDV